MFVERVEQGGKDTTLWGSYRAVRYDDIYRMDEIKSLSFHIMFYRLYRGVAKYIISGNTFHHLSYCGLYTPPTTGVKGRQSRWR